MREVFLYTELDVVIGTIPSVSELCHHVSIMVTVTSETLVAMFVGLLP